MPLSDRCPRALIQTLAIFALCLGFACGLTGCSCQSESVVSGSNAATASDSTASSSSTSASNATMPHLTGLSQADAESLLKEIGLTVTVEQQVADDRNQVGTVINQSPDAGTTVHTGDAATLTIGKKADSTSPSEATSTTDASSHMDDTGTTYDTSTLPPNALKTYRAASKALANDQSKAMAKQIAALYPDYPNAAQSLINTAKSRDWFPQFKKQLLKINPGANDILDLDE